jgi:hypothetical protein
MKIILKKRLDINPDAGKIRRLFKKKIDGKVYEGFETSFESKRASVRRKRSTGLDAGIESMNKTMQTTTQMVGNVAIAGMGIGLAGAVIGMI